MQTSDGRLIVVAGASRSGKTVYTLRQVKSEKRVLAYDPEAQWCELRGWLKVTTRAQLWALCQKPGPLRVAFVPGGDIKEAFDFFCAAAYYAGRYCGSLSVVAEELADVTTASKAPGNWGILLRRGLKRGITIYAISQRWAEADKTAIGNASEYVCFAQRGDDVGYMSKKTRIPMSTLEALRPLDWVRATALGEITKGRLKF